MGELITHNETLLFEAVSLCPFWEMTIEAQTSWPCFLLLRKNTDTRFVRQPIVWDGLASASLRYLDTPYLFLWNRGARISIITWNTVSERNTGVYKLFWVRDDSSKRQYM